MCIICIDLDKGKLDPWEASRNRTEMLEELTISDASTDHLEILDQKIRDALYQYLNELKE